MHKRQIFRGGFALPTVLIASVVMLIVLSVSVSSVAAVRTTLKTQYYEQLAKAAGEAGVAYAKACLAKNGNKPLWTDAKPLKPSTDCAGNALLSPEVQVLVVAGGGGGGNNHGGGGGGGGVVADSDFIVAGGQTYTAVVGTGGAGGASVGAAGARGGNSSFAGIIIAQGGGGGGGRIGANSVSQAATGGSGGGGAGTIDGATGIPGAGATGTAGQGAAGGSGSSGTTAGNGGGGGGAAGVGGAATGTAASTGISGDGGWGYLSDISGAVFYYGGGGSGGRWAVGPAGTPGITGGGRGAENDSTVGNPGQQNTGGGGGGGGGGSSNGGAGGSGVVYVRYANNGTINATGGSITPYTTGPYKVHAFTSVGSGSFSVSSATNSVCPSDPRCSVVVNDTLRSSFSVSRPTLDANGRALTIPNSGYVELLRSSTGAVWRTYRQPAVQVAAVPDLCSGAAQSALGWQNAVVSATQEAIPSASSAKTITLTDGNLAAGKMYYRKDFTVLEAGAYNFSFLTTNGSVIGESYIDGNVAITTRGGLASASTNLSVGCHTITVQLTNETTAPQPARFTAAIGRSGSAPIVETDSSWRVSAGSTVSFSTTDFYADPDIWTPVVGYASAHAVTANSTWTAVTGDAFTAMISPSGNGCPSSCPFDGTAYLRDSKDFYLPADTDVLVGAICDNSCAVYLDGKVILNNSWNDVNTQTITIPAGYHHMGIQLYNGAAILNPAGAGMTVVNKANGSVITRTDRSWLGGKSWVSGASGDITSYEATFTPSPKEIIDPVKADILMVAGGGGGGRGGGGGGGGVSTRSVAMSTGTYAVTVGNGGAGSAASNGANGGNSIFNGVTVAGGGGGGGASSVALPGSNGGSGGGGGLSINGTDGASGGAGTVGQGNNGGLGFAYSCSPAGGGGGGGAPGSDGISTKPGNGGAGIASLITGVYTYYAGGGGGGSWCLGGSLGAENAGNGATATGGAGIANTGGGGGGAGANGGSGGGAGGSGVVVVRFKTGSATVSATPGSYVFSQPTINNVKYDVYRFTSNGTLTISALNPS